MILRQLSLWDFRSYHKVVIDFSPEVTVIAGLNGVGKTNILEAIMAGATARSFRAGSDSETISWGSDIGRIRAETEENTLELVLTRGVFNGKKVPTKKYTVDGVPRRQLDFVGLCKAVLFWPEDLELVTDSPSLRRRYLDRVLIQTDREYRRSLYSYERGLRQRNRLLDDIRDGKAARSQLIFWDQLLIKTGGYLTTVRANFIGYVSGTTTGQLPYLLEYDKSVISEARLAEYAGAEVAAGATLVGPHRDDFQFKIKSAKFKVNEGLDLSKYGSRGEQRLGVLWLKMAELSYITNRTGDKPILLLDDIFSELDENNRAMVLGLVKNQQTVITSAEEETVGLLQREGISPVIVRPGEL